MLLVEDDEDLRETMAEYLRDSGYLVDTARNGAIEKLGLLDEHARARLA
ncbi:MAG: hypothetical protein WKG00_04140 [Polyangiaceae bacterium]